MKLNLFFNRQSWDEFNSSLAHKHTFDSAHGCMQVGSEVTLLRCKCGHPEWVGLGQTGK